MTSNTERFDQWIRGEFVGLNTALEELYSTGIRLSPHIYNNREQMDKVLACIC